MDGIRRPLRARLLLSAFVLVPSAIAAVLVAVLPPVAPGSAAVGTPLYPNLKTVPPSELQFDTEIFADGQTHHVLRFTNTAWNGGEGSLDLRGNQGGSDDVYQRIFDSNGGYTEQLIGQDFIFHPTHNHFHFQDFADYELWTKADWDAWIASGRTQGQARKFGTKTTFCVQDTTIVQQLPNTPSSPAYGTCTATVQGLDVGWGDTYRSHLDEQWVDLGLTPLPDGEYVLRSVVDPDNKIFESAGKNDPARESAETNEAVTFFTVLNNPGPNEGLVAAYAFDEGIGTSVADSSSRGNTGAVSGAAWTGAGRNGGALSFDGVNDWMTVPDATSLDLSNRMTLEAWLKPTATSGWRTALMKETATGFVYALYANTSGNRPRAYIGSTSVTDAAQLPANAWSHVATTYDGSTLRLYVNGSQVATRALTVTMPNSTSPLRIGGNAVWGEFFAGAVDDVRIYSRALTQTEIQTDMNTAVNGAPPPPPDTTPPSVAISAPAPGATLTGSITVKAVASDTGGSGLAGVQFTRDGQNLGAEDTSAPYQVTWNTTSAGNGPHTLAAVARDGSGNTTTAADVAVTVDNPPPSVAGLVAAFSFNEGAGTTATDTSGRGNDGTVNGATWTGAGRNGGALSFDGVNDWVTVSDSTSLDFTTTMTLEAWLRPSANSGWRTALMKERPGGLVYALYANTSANRPRAYVNTTTTNGSAQLVTGVWTHVAATYDGSVSRLYVNGVQVDSRSRAVTMVDSSGPLRIGGNGVWGEYFAGLVDDVRVYDRALTQNEIQADMPVGVGG